MTVNVRQNVKMFYTCGHTIFMTRRYQLNDIMINVLMQKYRKLSPSFPCYPFLSAALNVGTFNVFSAFS